jgi:hypothetical protein
LPDCQGLGRKARRAIRRNASSGVLRRPICHDASDGSQNGPYYWEQHIEGFPGIYIVLGFELKKQGIILGF